MKFNVYFTFTNLGKSIEVPNKTNPVEIESLSILLGKLSNNLPYPFGCICTGVRVEEVI